MFVVFCMCFINLFVFSKYRLMENQLLKQQHNKREQRSEMIKNLKACEYLQSKKDSTDEILTNFQVSEQLFGTATIDQPCNNVAIWLGANVMLEFTIPDALEFLQKRVDVCVCLCLYSICLNLCILFVIFL